MMDQSDKYYSYNVDYDTSSFDKTGVVTTHHYFQGQLLYETLSTDASNVIHALYLRSLNGTLEPVSLNYVVGGTSNSYYYYHYNAQGDVVAVTDSTGAVYRQYVYDPYGNVISVKDGSGTPVDISNDSGFNNVYTYRGYRYDADTGLYYLNARYYGAGIGRFLTKDTWKGAGTNPQTLNRYAYAIGDPVNFIDHDGHRPDVTGGPEDISVYNSVSDQPYRPVPSPFKANRYSSTRTMTGSWAFHVNKTASIVAALGSTTALYGVASGNEFLGAAGLLAVRIASLASAGANITMLLTGETHGSLAGVAFGLLGLPASPIRSFVKGSAFTTTGKMFFSEINEEIKRYSNIFTNVF